MPSMILKPGREKSLLRRHPWIFSGAVKSADAIAAGDIVAVRAADGRFLAHAACSPASQIVARVLSFDEQEAINADFFARRIAASLARRSGIASTNALRLVHGESDGLPGLVADRYGDVVVMQLTTAGIEPVRDLIAGQLLELTGARTIHERSDADVRELEGLAARCGPVRGEPLAGDVDIAEHGLVFGVDVISGHKTGFYLDQRDNRARVRELAAGRDVLNCFCYSGTMSLAALAGGAASVVSIDSSAPALARAAAMVEANRLDASRATWMEADVFQALRKFRDAGRSFDFIILDPPKLAPTAHHVEKAARAYKDINLLAFKLLRPGGLLMTFSCSGGVSADLFQKIVAGAALDARADGQILGRLAAGTDHPVLLSFPEGDYLKGLLVRKG
ncbi:MAG TPA: class I SAM-dependent methyltransferase [Usitatibacteraceae bacterium]|nr:class I SAM-dependent methyltransferase [Usitatibacteraceae bacterium]